MISGGRIGSRLVLAVLAVGHLFAWVFFAASEARAAQPSFDVVMLWIHREYGFLTVLLRGAFGSGGRLRVLDSSGLLRRPLGQSFQGALQWFETSIPFYYHSNGFICQGRCFLRREDCVWPWWRMP